MMGIERGWSLSFESIHLFGPIDLDVGDEGEGVGEDEVLAWWGSWVVGHGGMRDWMRLGRAGVGLWV